LVFQAGSLIAPLSASTPGSTVVEAAGSHAIYVSQPAAVAAIIEKAAGAVKAAAN
jgi:hypothetical protein